MMRESASTLSLAPPTRTAWLPFNLDTDSHIRFGVMVNGRPATAILDSGATRTVVGYELAKQLALHLEPGFQASGLTRGIKGHFARNLEVLFGGVRMPIPKVAVVDLSAIGAASRNPIDLVLGQEIFEQRIVDIDFPSHRLCFRDPGRAISDAYPVQVPLRRATDGMRTIAISLEGRTPIQASIDLGSNVPLYVSPDYCAAVRMLDGKKWSTSLTAGAEGPEIGQVAALSRLEMADIEINDIPVAVPATWKHHSPALIGLPILRRFRMITDFARDVLWLMADRQLVRTPFAKDRSGMGTVPAGDRLRIVHVAPSSPAEEIGLKIGDEILSINGRRVDAEYLRSGRREGKKETGTSFILGLSDGSERRMVLADYY